MHNKAPVLIIYPYFYPAQKAGGIVTSLMNLVSMIGDRMIYVYTSCYDLDGTRLLSITANKWSAYNKNTQIFYADTNHRPDFKELVNDYNIKYVYINGIYGYKYVTLPLFQLRKVKRVEVVIAPRGMMHPNALKQKWVKKKIYFALAKLFNLFRDVQFHAINTNEQRDIELFTKGKNKVLIANDCVDKAVITLNHHLVAPKEPIRLLFLSLLTPIKNLQFLLSIIQKIDTKITLHIYGPIKDEAYWNECLSTINTLPNVHYCGEVPPTEVTQKMNEYDYFVLPTLGENFGHVIFESLVAGTPVIISDKTSWQHIDASHVGWVIPLEEPLWIERLESLAAIKNEEYMEMSANCHRYIENYLAENNPVKEYEVLFG